MFRRLIALCLLIVLCLLCTTAGSVRLPAAAAHSPERTPARPNVVLIMADDAGPEAFGCYGGQEVRTPRIDALAAAGMRFTHCFATPLCTPTRVRLMTGRYSFRNYTRFGYLDPSENTIGHLLRKAGYRTAVIGKWQLNGLYDRLPGSNDSSRPQQAGFEEHLLWQLTRTARRRDGGGERYWSPVLDRNGTLLTSKDTRGQYGPDLLCEAACDFIRRHRSEPFFLYYPMVLVHSPFVPTPQTIGTRSRGHDANRPPANAAVRKQNFLSMVEAMDRIVGRLVDQIVSLNLENRTLLLFTTDNGTHTSLTLQMNGRTVRGGKGTLTDAGTHVPLIAWWPGTVPAGTVCDDLIDFADFFPTLADAAGMSVSEWEPLDGCSFWPQLTGRVGHPRNWLLCHYQPWWDKTPGRFVRTQRYSLYEDGRFFDLLKDPEERQDLSAAVPAEARRCRAFLQSILDQCPPAPGPSDDRHAPVRPVYPDWPKIDACGAGPESDQE